MIILVKKRGRFQEGLSNVFSDLLMNTSEMVEVDGVPAVFFSYIFNCFGAQEVNFLRQRLVGGTQICWFSSCWSDELH